VAVWKLKPLEPRRVVRFDHVLPDNQQFNIAATLFGGHALAVSPDGSQFVYSTDKGLYRRSVDQMNASLILGTEKNPRSPFFSPDGKWLGFWSRVDNKLYKIALSGGVPLPLCDVTWLDGAIWYSDNTIIYSDVQTGIMRVSANGGTPEILVKGSTQTPQLIQNGKSVIFTQRSAGPSYSIAAQPLEFKERKQLCPGELVRYLPTGHLVYMLRNNLYAVPFDPDRHELTGGAAPIRKD
jgi:Tol biopolymer transport system component